MACAIALTTLACCTVEQRVRAALKRREQPKDYGKRISELNREIANITASGLLRSSPALGTRLAAAEGKLARLQSVAKPVTIIAPNDTARLWLDSARAILPVQ